jgi:Bacterial PH domain
MKAVNLEKLLPGDIPQGEKILWHGRPHWVSLARRAYRADFVAAYFVALTVWNCVSVGRTSGYTAAGLVGAKTLGIGAAALALLALLAYASARTTLYVVTTRRLVLKVGVALPIFINLPFTQIASAAARLYSDGTGDIPLALTPAQRVAYFALWPHARPFHFRHPQPALRCVAHGVEVAEILSRALTEAAGQTDRARVREIGALVAPHQAPAALPEQAVA